MAISNTLLVMCNGPSIKPLVDYGLQRLPNCIDTVATSLAYRYFSEINWWPTYYTLGDPKVLLHHQQAFQAMISDPNIPVRQYYLATQLPKLGIDIEFDDPLNKLVNIPWQVTGQSALKIGLVNRYQKIYIIGCDNKYYWDHGLVRPLASNKALDNRAEVIDDVPENPNYGIPNYLRKGDITSWLFNHPDKSYSTSSHNNLWLELMTLAEKQNIQVTDFSSGNLPMQKASCSIVDFVDSLPVEPVKSL